jgi:hypothetical protein
MPADDEKTLGLARVQIGAAKAMRKTQYQDKVNLANIRAASSDKSERDRIARVEAQRKLINDQRAPLEKQLSDVGQSIRQAIEKNAVWTKAITAYGLDPADESQWNDSAALVAARPWLAPNNDELIAAVGKANLGEALKMRALIDRKEAERTALVEKIKGLSARTESLEAQLAGTSVAPAADPMIDPVDGMTEEQRAALLKALGL